MEIAPSRIAARSVSGSMSSMKLLFVQPEILAAARVGAGCSRLRVIFDDWRVKRTSPFQACGTFTFSRTPGRQAFGKHQRHRLRANLRGRLEVELLAAIGHRHGDRRDAIDGRFHRRAHRAGIIDVLAHVSAAIDSGDDQVRLLLEQACEARESWRRRACLRWNIRARRSGPYKSAGAA